MRSLLRFSPNGAAQASPGQRPGLSWRKHSLVLKGRPNCGLPSDASGAGPIGPPLQGLVSRWFGDPGRCRGCLEAPRWG
jgi:hypothetical protein